MRAANPLKCPRGACEWGQGGAWDDDLEAMWGRLAPDADGPGPPVGGGGGGSAPAPPRAALAPEASGCRGGADAVGRMAAGDAGVESAAGLGAERPVGADAVQDWMATEARAAAEGEDDGEDGELGWLLGSFDDGGA